MIVLEASALVDDLVDQANKEWVLEQILGREVQEGPVDHLARVVVAPDDRGQREDALQESDDAVEMWPPSRSRSSWSSKVSKIASKWSAGGV